MKMSAWLNRTVRGAIAGFAALAALAGGIGAPVAIAQDRGGSTPACPTCKITLTRIGQIDGSDDEHGFPGTPGHFARDAKGQFWVGFYSKSEPLIYDVGGRILRSVGPIGKGPGEVSGPDAWPMRGRGDSMLVMDPRNGRMNVFDPSGKYVRSQYSLHRHSVTGVIQLPDGRFVASGPDAWRRNVIELQDSTGRPIRGLSPPKPKSATGSSKVRLYQMIAPVGRGFWAIDRFNYTIQVFEDVDRPPVTLPYRPAWFVASDTGQPFRPTLTPQMQVMSVTADEAGRVWVVTAVPDPKWRTSWGKPERQWRPFGKSAVVPRIARVEHYYDTQIEVFDVSSRRLIASWKTDLAVWAMYPGRVLLASNGDGTMFTIHRATLVDRD